MGAKLINIYPAGAIKQGSKIADLDYSVGTVSIWSIVLCKINGLLVAFSKHSTGTTYSPCNTDQLANFVRDNQDAPAVLTFLDAIKPYCLSPTASQGLAYVTDATETGLYFDGVNKITTAPVKPLTTEEVLKQALGGSGTPGTGTPGPGEKKWYETTIAKVAGVGILITVVAVLVKKFAY